MQSFWQTWAPFLTGIGVAALLIGMGAWWFKVEEKIGDKRDAQSSLLALRSASRLIFSGIVLLLLSFVYLWAMEFARAAMN
jgi:hypothetical protein